MDVAGARILSDRLRRRGHLHWHVAPAVRDGLQEAHDPDADWLIGQDASSRVYATPTGRFRKELMNGRWVKVADPSIEAEPAAG